MHCTVQVTPSGATSLVTVTLTGACVALTRDAGGADAKEIDGSGGGAWTTVVVAKAGLEGVVAADAAVMVTILPLGTVAGAV